MKPKPGYYVSDGGSVRVMSGEFFDNAWNLLFTPQSNLEFRQFLDRVEEEERSKGRLSAADLEAIVATFNG